LGTNGVPGAFEWATHKHRTPQDANNNYKSVARPSSSVHLPTVGSGNQVICHCQRIRSGDPRTHIGMRRGTFQLSMHELVRAAAFNKNRTTAARIEQQQQGRDLAYHPIVQGFSTILHVISGIQARCNVLCMCAAGQALFVTPSSSSSAAAAAAGHKMSLRWFKGPDGVPFQVKCVLGIHVPRIAHHLHLKARRLMLNGVVVEFDSSTGYMVDTAFLADRGATRASAIQVTGQPAGELSAINCACVKGLCACTQDRHASSHVAADLSSRQCITCPTSSTLAWQAAPWHGELLRVKKCAISLKLSRAPHAAVNMRITGFTPVCCMAQALSSSCAIVFDLCCWQHA
jgi:hypothetical protein